MTRAAEAVKEVSLDGSKEARGEKESKEILLSSVRIN